MEFSGKRYCGYEPKLSIMSSFPCVKMHWLLRWVFCARFTVTSRTVDRYFILLQLRAQIELITAATTGREIGCIRVCVYIHIWHAGSGVWWCVMWCGDVCVVVCVCCALWCVKMRCRMLWWVVMSDCASCGVVLLWLLMMRWKMWCLCACVVCCYVLWCEVWCAGM